MIVLQIEIPDFLFPYLESEPPVSADGYAPCPGAIALKLMHAPPGRANDTIHVRGGYQHRENVANPPHEFGAEFPAVVVLDKAREPPMPDAPDLHEPRVRQYRTIVKP